MHWLAEFYWRDRCGDSYESVAAVITRDQCRTKIGQESVRVGIRGELSTYSLTGHKIPDPAAAMLAQRRKCRVRLSPKRKLDHAEQLRSNFFRSCR